MFKKIVFSLLALFFILPFVVSADGGIIPPPNYYVREDSQKAVIVYDQGMETLILSVEFSGDAKQFGWLIPTPARPEVSKSSDELFKSLEDLTVGERVYQPADMMLERTQGLGSPESVTVLERKKIDIYDIAVLESTSSQDLAKWLKENGFQYPENEAYIFDDYIKNNWIFTAVKVQSEFLDTVASKRLSEGRATPLQLVFKSENIVYPLKISAVQVEKVKEKNTNQILDDERDLYTIQGETAVLKQEYQTIYYPPTEPQVGITLYVLADHKKTVPGFTTDYAGFVKPEQIEKWAIVSGKPCIQASKKYYLTKLSDSMTTSEMTDDLYLRDADNNKTVGTGVDQTSKTVAKEILYCFLYLIIWIISPIGIIFLIATLVQFLAKSNVAHIIALAFQILMFLGNLIFVILFNLAGLDSTSTFKMSLGLNIASYLTVLVMIIVFICQEIYKRKSLKK
ncbi:MAG: DUF2330 domain-containing protein [Patescibacteria group bacterium]|nr:DUF2330 domain-containing protein [Patescibacteria group bacterium]